MNKKSQNNPVDLKTIIAEEEEYKKDKDKLVGKYAHDLETRRSQLTRTINTLKDKLKKFESAYEAGTEDSLPSSNIEPKNKDNIHKQISGEYYKNKEKALSYLKGQIFS